MVWLKCKTRATNQSLIAHLGDVLNPFRQAGVTVVVGDVIDNDHALKDKYSVKTTPTSTPPTSAHTHISHTYGAKNVIER